MSPDPLPEDHECIHLIVKPFCTICNGKNARLREESASHIEATFRAKFAGQCPGCNLPIAVGQIIHKMSDDYYVHEGCQ